MKIKDGLNLPGWRAQIPEAKRSDLAEFFKEMGYKKGAEIGVEKGRFSAELVKSGAHLYCIDPWRVYPDYKERSMPQYVMDKNFIITQRRLAPYKNHTIIRKSSMEALADFEDRSLDFVYIDGNHGYKHVVEDLFEWSKKVRKGGVISGHDYTIITRRRAFYCDVKWAVDGFVRAGHIKKWYLIGTRNSKRRDHFRSFMWINP